MDAMSDDEMEGEDGGRGPQMSRSFNAITPAQLALVLAAAAGGGRYYLDEMSDDEMEGEDGGRGPQRRRSFNAVTPPQLAEALAAAA